MQSHSEQLTSVSIGRFGSIFCSASSSEPSNCVLAAVRKFLKDVGFSNVYVVALGDSNPQKKADWIQSQIQKGYNDILFLDDSPKNVKVVKKLKQKYPNIKMDARVVKYD